MSQDRMAITANSRRTGELSRESVKCCRKTPARAPAVELPFGRVVDVIISGLIQLRCAATRSFLRAAATCRIASVWIGLRQGARRVRAFPLARGIAYLRARAVSFSLQVL